jgi:hypothetical protein
MRHRIPRWTINDWPTSGILETGKQRGLMALQKAGVILRKGGRGKQVDDKLISMIYVTLTCLSVIWVSFINRISPTLQSIVEPAISGLLGAAAGRVTKEVKVAKSLKKRMHQPV